MLDVKVAHARLEACARRLVHALPDTHPTFTSNLSRFVDSAQASRIRQMAVVRLRAPLSELAGGSRELRLDGTTVADVLRSLERDYPDISGWILDERGQIREHINVFVNHVNGDEQTPTGPDDRVHVLPAISGGQA
jgi:sulfur-carrier protein